MQEAIMLTEKNRRLKSINILTWLIMAGVTLISYFLPLNANHVLTMETKYPGALVGPAFVWYLFFLTLLALAGFIWFQARSLPHQDLLRAKTRHALGWTAGASFLLYALATVLWHYEKLGWTITVLALTAIVLFIVNGNIREDAELMDEKFWVRNPFSLFLGWVLHLLMMTIAMRWHASFSQEMPAFLLITASLILVIWYGFANLNTGVLFIWLIALLLKLLQNPSQQTLVYALWGGVAALLISIFLIARRGPHAQYYRKPVAKAMDKYNFGRPSQLEALENELNDQLQTKPGARITIK